MEPRDALETARGAVTGGNRVGWRDTRGAAVPARGDADIGRADGATLVEAAVADGAAGAIAGGNSVGGHGARDARVATRGDAGVRDADAAAAMAVVPAAVQRRAL